ncbi:MocR-like pyridoxine biosynthesis transcription factor PdxR [Pectobacterium quasiaquaticum]|uniref:MocR-like pyridoxine biosynthesis transcription factor PdxR n=3 Tax=Pectobacterium TaxID=122277 RepID=UPI001CF7DB45|nr:PLP-dependent aminotransferase family protein [Pectobacterium quasiaquaticum]
MKYLWYYKKVHKVSFLWGHKMFDITEPLHPGATTADGERISLQKQLKERIRHAILSGFLPPEKELLSSRALSKELGISRNTVVNVYDQLAAEGYILADRQGTRVAALSGSDRVIAPALKLHMSDVKLAERLSPFVDNARSLPADTLLSPGIPALREFPLSAWRRSLDRAARQLLPSSLGYAEPMGERTLREALATHLFIARGVRCEASSIIITEGARQALELCVNLLTDPGDTVWMEDPGYYGARATFNASKLRTVMMAVDEDGMRVPDEAWQTPIPKLVYTSPAHQYPTGAVLSVSRRLALISEAEKTGAWIIEDDYDGDFRHSGSPISCMQGLLENASVLYIGSFSKTMFPSLRIGFVVLPASIIEQAGNILNEVLRNGQHLQQLALADFMKSGEFGRHLGRMRRLYRDRQRILRDALTANFAHDQILGGKSGIHLVLKLASGTDDKRIAELARQKGLGVQALSSYSASTDSASGLVIGYGNTHAEDIPAAVNVLTSLIKLVNGDKVF